MCNKQNEIRLKGFPFNFVVVDPTIVNEEIYYIVLACCFLLDSCCFFLDSKRRQLDIFESLEI